MQITGTITCVHPRTNLDGRLWAEVTVQDGEVTELVKFFPGRYQQFAHLLQENTQVAITGREGADRDGRFWFPSSVQAGA